MLRQEYKLQILDIFVILVSSFLACFFGKISMVYFGDNWMAFYGSAFVTLFICGAIWRTIRRIITK